ncbi:MAG: T9SS type A sorting domain-containing protein, partial [Bacteroidetes bacterium]|nr:T9SS type A sorting domain-containing protein [Bacteroidota bacterium]
IYRSSDGGFSWDLIGLDGIDVRSIVINSNNIIYAATYGDGIFHSVDNGSTWVELNAGIERKQYVMALSLDKSGHLYAGTWYGGVFKSNQITTSIQESRIYNSYTFDLLHNYPNPFNPTTTIQYTLMKTEYVKIELFNSLGELIQIVEKGVKEAGTYKLFLSFNNNLLSSGIYFYRIKAGDFIQTKKMILLK